MVAPAVASIGFSLAASAAGDVLGKVLDKVGLSGTSKVVRDTTHVASGALLGTTANNIVNTLSSPAR
jgi:hypothetical protein